MWIALRRAGEPVARCTVERPRRQARGKPWPHAARPAEAQAPDLVDRDLTATGPDWLWVADLTYLRGWEGVGLFAFVLDAWSRRVVGWQLAGHMRSTLVLDALRMALHQRRRRAGAPQRSRSQAHLDRLHPDTDRARRARERRLGR